MEMEMIIEHNPMEMEMIIEHNPNALEVQMMLEDLCIQSPGARGSCSYEDDRVVVSVRDIEEGAAEEAELPLVDLFVRRIIEGKWNESLSILRDIGPLDENIIMSASSLILEQNFYELWNEDRFEEFMEIARLYNKLDAGKPKGVSDPGMKQMLFFIVYTPQMLDDNVVESTGWLELASRKRFIDQLQKSRLESRLILLDGLHKLIYPAVLIPHGNACRFHNSLVGMSQVAHHCGRDRISAQSLQILQEHDDKIWFLQFSHNGKYLASSSGDCLVIIWEVALDSRRVYLKHKLTGHRKPVSYMSWSPDDDVQLLTCGADEVVRRWDVASGLCLHVYKKSGVGLVTCGWAPDGKSIFSGVSDNSICMWDIKGNELEWWRVKEQRAVGITDLGIAGKEKQLVTAFRENVILLFGWESKTEKFIEEDKKISSFSLSEDGRFLLVSLGNEELHLWDIDGCSDLVATFRGGKSWRSDVRSCCGNAFVASGSDDSQVYIWDRLSGELVLTIAGHPGVVNCVCWNPSIPHMLASASNRTIRIWGLNQVNAETRFMDGSSSLSRRFGDLSL